MVIKIAAPILEGDRRMIGILYAAVLLNNNSGFIDRFKRLVFKEEKFRGKDVGTTTLFLGDVRIATNVIDSEGRRAIGTQVSEQVYRRVYEEGRVWLDKAFVVDNWYMSGYSPLFDIDEASPSGCSTSASSRQKYDLILRGTSLSFLLAIFADGRPGHRSGGLSHQHRHPARQPDHRRLDGDRGWALSRGSRRDPDDDEDARKLGGPSTGWSTPSRSATASSRSRPSGPSSSPRSSPRSAGWPRASPTRSTTP